MAQHTQVLQHGFAIVWKLQITVQYPNADPEVASLAILWFTKDELAPQIKSDIKTDF